jgi:hypothetical protein
MNKLNDFYLFGVVELLCEFENEAFLMNQLNASPKLLV